jgi:4-hydroxybenzoate polyprenyltransferase
MHFLRLIRPVNLLIIVLTMYAMRIFFVDFLLSDIRSFSVNNEALDFALLVFSTVLIAAAGNIINDYFDVKADRINKPNRLIITKHLKRRWAIVTHWLFNLIAFAIAVYLTVRHGSFIYLFIHLLSINLLWFYSMDFKRRYAIGNVIIAALTGLVPILVSVYFLNVFNLGISGTTWLETLTTIGHDYFAFNPSQTNTGQLILNFGFALGVFAFLTNLAREVVKDAEDVKGDLELGAKTIPIVSGFSFTRKVVSVLLIVPAAIFAGFLCCSGWLTPKDMLIVLAPIAVALLIQLIALTWLWISNSDEKYRIVNTLLKLSMLSGLFTPIYLTWL